MSWYYRPVKNIAKTGVIYWTVREFYPPGAWTGVDIEPQGETRKDLIQCLRWMLKDCLKRKTLIIDHRSPHKERE